jgi:hypothetical protein
MKWHISCVFDKYNIRLTIHYYVKYDSVSMICQIDNVTPSAHNTRKKSSSKNFNLMAIFITGILMLAVLFSVPHLIQVSFAKKAPAMNVLDPIHSNTIVTPNLLFPNNGILNPGAAGPGLYISQSTAYRDSTGIIHVVGEIQNVFSFPVSSVKVTASIYGPDNVIVGTTSSYADIDQLRPGEKSGFQIVLPNTLIGGGTGKQYQLSTSYAQASTQKPPVLNLILGQPYTDSSGQYHVVGEIINQGQQAANAVKVSTVFYDPKGKLVDEIFGYTIPTDLLPGMAAQFDIKPLSADLAHKAKFASTNVQSQQFSSMNYDRSTVPGYQQQRLGGTAYPLVTPGISLYSPFHIGHSINHGIIYQRGH